jgi:hypothetical protein
VVPVRREVHDEAGAAHRPRGEAGEPQVAAVRGDQQRQPNRAHGSRDLSDAAAHATTTEQTAV